MYVATNEVRSYIISKSNGNYNIYIQNQIPTKSISSMLPKEVWCGYKPSKNHLCVFCCVTFSHVPKEVRTKLDSKGVKCIFIAYYEETKGVTGVFYSFK
jgi:hypothetical protein